MPWLDMNVFRDWRIRHELVVIAVGLINVILTAITYRSGTDEVYLSVVCVCFVVSLNCVLLQVLSCIQNNWHTVKFCEMVFHWLAAVVLLFETVTFLIGTFQIINGNGPTIVGIGVIRFISSACGFASSFIYATLALSATDCSVSDRSGQITCIV